MLSRVERERNLGEEMKEEFLNYSEWGLKWREGLDRKARENDSGFKGGYF